MPSPWQFIATSSTDPQTQTSIFRFWQSSKITGLTRRADPSSLLELPSVFRNAQLNSITLDLHPRQSSKRNQCFPDTVQLVMAISSNVESPSLCKTDSPTSNTQNDGFTQFLTQVRRLGLSGTQKVNIHCGLQRLHRGALSNSKSQRQEPHLATRDNHVRSKLGPFWL